MTTTEKQSTSLQLWPGGKTVRVRGEGKEMEILAGPDNSWRKPTEAEYKAVRIEQDAERYAEMNILCCDSSLVTDAMALDGEGELGREFSWDNVSSGSPDPSEWTISECKEWLDDNGHDQPDADNPWKMGRPELLALLDGELDDDEDAGELTDEQLLEKALEYMDGDGGYVDAWREAVTEAAEGGEIYEWWRVDDWLGNQLEEVGERVLDNAYGQWWGRQTTGQGYIMDGVLQKVAKRLLDKYGY